MRARARARLLVELGGACGFTAAVRRCRRCRCCRVGIVAGECACVNACLPGRVTEGSDTPSLSPPRPPTGRSVSAACVCLLCAREEAQRLEALRTSGMKTHLPNRLLISITLFFHQPLQGNMHLPPYPPPSLRVTVVNLVHSMLFPSLVSFMWRLGVVCVCVCVYPHFCTYFAGSTGRFEPDAALFRTVINERMNE